MNRFASGFIRMFCDPTRSEELTGDLEELHALRSERHGRHAASRRLWVDLVSLGLRQSRLRTWTARQWTMGGVVLATLAAGSLGARDEFPRGAFTISARDAAGSFTLKFGDGKVLEARVNEVLFPAERIRRISRGVRLLGAGMPGDLEIRLTPEGGISWKGRPAPQSAPAPIDLTLAHEYVAELAAASALEAGKLWGKPLFGPLLLVDLDTRFVVGTQSDSAGTLRPNDGLFTGTWPADEPIANTATQWHGVRWTMIMWPLPSERYARQRLAFHELFHRIQPELGHEGANPANEHLGARDGRIWTRLEWRALAEALIRQGAARRSAVEDALTFRARRRSLFPNAAADERALEMNEGLAEYTGLKLSGLPATLLPDRAAVELNRREQQESLTRSFAYASGPAYAILLDELGNTTWRRSLTRTSDLSEMVRTGYRLAVDPRGGDAEQRGLRYGSGRIIADETALAGRLAATRARLQARLQDGPTLTAPVASRFSYSFDPNGVTPLPGIGTAYEGARISDEWGILAVESGGVLMVRPSGTITQVVVPVPPNAASPPTTGEGWRLELAPGWIVVPAARAGSWEVRRRP